MELKICNLVKKYGKHTAVNGISFTVKKGSPLALIGRNGAGKSTTIKMILGLVSADSGTIKMDRSLKVGYLPEERGVYQDATVDEHLDFFARIAKVKDVKKAKSYWLEKFELYNYKDFKLKDLSKGNAQKVQLAITLINNPDIVILDEPLSGLDPVNIELFKKIINSECRDKYLIMCGHQMNHIESLCDNVVLMKEGNVVAQGNLNEVKRKYGRKKVIINYNSKYYEKLKDYNIKRDNNDIIIYDIESLADLEKLISKLDDNVLYIKYQLPTLQELFIKLLEGAEGQ